MQLRLQTRISWEFLGTPITFKGWRDRRLNSARPVSQLTFPFAKKMLTTNLEGRTKEALETTHEIFSDFRQTPLPQERILSNVGRLNVDGYKVSLKKNDKGGPPMLHVETLKPGVLYSDPKLLIKPNEVQVKILTMLKGLLYLPYTDANKAYNKEISKFRKTLWIAYGIAKTNPERIKV
jgi:hypothetical protein